jgi:hypothetical protein
MPHFVTVSTSGELILCTYSSVGRKCILYWLVLNFLNWHSGHETFLVLANDVGIKAASALALIWILRRYYLGLCYWQAYVLILWRTIWRARGLKFTSCIILRPFIGISFYIISITVMNYSVWRTSISRLLTFMSLNCKTFSVFPSFSCRQEVKWRKVTLLFYTKLWTWKKNTKPVRSSLPHIRNKEIWRVLINFFWKWECTRFFEKVEVEPPSEVIFSEIFSSLLEELKLQNCAKLQELKCSFLFPFKEIDSSMNSEMDTKITNK